MSVHTPPVPVPPTVRLVTGWLTPQDDLGEDERLELKQILDRRETLATTYRQVHEFAEVLTHRQRDNHLQD